MFTSPIINLKTLKLLLYVHISNNKPEDLKVTAVCSHLQFDLNKNVEISNWDYTLQVLLRLTWGPMSTGSLLKARLHFTSFIKANVGSNVDWVIVEGQIILYKFY